MLNLEELEKFVAFADNGTLLKVSEKLHISQPTLTRSMRRVEEEFGVSLFVRGKNKIELNETGKKAVEYARELLANANHAVSRVREFDRQLRTITIQSCAPMPLWTLLPTVSSQYPKNTISAKLCSISDIIENIEQGNCDIGILPFSYIEYKKQTSLSRENREKENQDSFLQKTEDLGKNDSFENTEYKIVDYPFIREGLSVCIPKTHELAVYDELTFEQINGFNCLLRDEIGFWTELCYEKMPASKFLIQTDEFEMEELIRTSTLFCFSTNLAHNPENLLQDRKTIPLTDKEADVTYHLICQEKKRGMFQNLFRRKEGI